MPAEISAPKQAKIRELHQSGLNMTEIGAALGVARNTVAKIVHQTPGKNGRGANSLRLADLNTDDILKLTYFLRERMAVAPCPTVNCAGTLIYLTTDPSGVCPTCNRLWEAD